jgi:hypothetical protein
MTNENEYGKLGDVLCIKMNLITFNEKTGNNNLFVDKTVLSVDELNNGNYKVVTSVPIMIDESTRGDYEVICEHGNEIRVWE